MSEALAKRATKEIKQRIKAAGKGTELRLAGAGIGVVPGALCERMAAFARIDLSDNQLTAFPSEVYQWKQLRELVLGLHAPSHISHS